MWRAAGQKELLRYGAIADTVKPGAPQFTTHSSQWTQVNRSNRSNCGERLEAQGGTLLASHGPDLIEVNRRSSDMMQFERSTTVLQNHRVTEPPCCVHRLWTTVWTNDLLTLSNTRNSAQIHRETA
jgi:hypothetical protein